MRHLTDKERELVAIGAALGSNCIPCVVYHIRESRNKGLTDDQIRESIEVAEGVRKMPAELVRSTAYAQLKTPADSPDEPCGCGDTGDTDSPPCCG